MNLASDISLVFTLVQRWSQNNLKQCVIFQHVCLQYRFTNTYPPILAARGIHSDLSHLLSFWKVITKSHTYFPHTKWHHVRKQEKHHSVFSFSGLNLFFKLWGWMKANSYLRNFNMIFLGKKHLKCPNQKHREISNTETLWFLNIISFIPVRLSGDGWHC